MKADVGLSVTQENSDPTVLRAAFLLLLLLHMKRVCACSDCIQTNVLYLESLRDLLLKLSLCYDKVT